MDKATPRPWTVKAINNPAAPTTDVWGDDANGRALLITSQELAALIVKAVNSHARLVEALECVIADIESYEKVNNLSPAPGKADCWQSVTIARAALKSAKGET